MEVINEIGYWWFNLLWMKRREEISTKCAAVKKKLSQLINTMLLHVCTIIGLELVCAGDVAIQWCGG